LKLGPILRGELDSRSYFFLFKTLPCDLTGFHRLWVLLTRKRMSEALIAQAGPGHVVETSGLGGLFVELLGHQAFLREELMAMLANNRVMELEKFYNNTNAIAVHVRYGDFSAVDQSVSKGGGANRRQPIAWYVSAVEAVRRQLGEDTLVNVFSDATEEELAPLTALPCVRSVQGNSAIEDMLLMSSHRMLVASGSTFSMWASFLGQMPTIWFPGQMKFRLLREDDCEIEYEPGADLAHFCLSSKRVAGRKEV
jgi:hypothetical protein